MLGRLSALIQVDGVGTFNVGYRLEDIEIITVLKDAFATAVFGVRGANGVVLITKRGSEGPYRRKHFVLGSHSHQGG